MSRPVAASLTVFLVFAVAGAIAGCGTSNDPAEPMSKAEYLKRANQICKQGVEEKDQAVKKGLEETPRNEFPNLSQQTLKRLGEDALPPFEKVVNELTELTPPAKDKAALEKLVARLKAAAVTTKSEPILLAKGDPFRKAAIAARAYGLEACAL
jgi:hypothetical protein